jgi:ABC-type multidrug transport system fused ATPase/permease subunit
MYIRRAIFEQNPASKINTYRNLSDMVKLFKRQYFIMLALLLLSIISLVIILVIYPNSPFVLIPMACVFLIIILISVQREKHIYNQSVRAQEISEIEENYKEYVMNVLNTLASYGIDTPDKLHKLREECKSELKKYEEKLDRVNSKIFDMLIGVPLGALVASLIYSNSNTIPVAIVAIIIIGLVLLGLTRLIGYIEYYSEGYFKDKYLFEAINELDYYEK